MKPIIANTKLGEYRASLVWSVVCYQQAIATGLYD